MSDTLVFLDLETTGLGRSAQTIEIGILPVNVDLEPIDPGWSALIHTDPQILEHMNETVTQMHTENGLLAALAAGEGIGIGEAVRQAMTYLAQYGQPGQIPLAGSSVHFDRKFLERNLPQIEAWFHYRNFDVSTVKQVWRLWFPGNGEPPKVKAHRALDDCYGSVAELKWYKERLRNISDFERAVARR